MTTHIPLGEGGIAAFEVSDAFASTELLNSAIPFLVTEDFPVPENSDFEAFSVVGVTAAGDLTMAVSGVVQALGVLTVPVNTGAGETKSAAIFRAGNFNTAALVYDASFDTAAKKQAAFRGAPAPTNIVVRSRL